MLKSAESEIKRLTNRERQAVFTESDAEVNSGVSVVNCMLMDSAYPPSMGGSLQMASPKLYSYDSSPTNPISLVAASLNYLQECDSCTIIKSVKYNLLGFSN